MSIPNFEKMGSEELRNFLASGRKKTLEFWIKNIEIAAPEAKNDEHHYIARILTRFSLFSTSDSKIHFPTFISLAQIYDEFLRYAETQETPQFMEIAGSQTLLLGGFYMEKAKKHYNMRDIENIGRLFFTKAAVGKRAKTIRKIARDFGKWQNSLCFLEWYLRNEAPMLVLHIEETSEPLIKIIPP